MRVAIQGEPGAFSHEAARRVVGEAEVVPCRTFDALFDALSAGEAEVAVVPVENTLAGMVQRPMDLIAERSVHAFAEVRVPVRLCLAARPGARLRDLKTVASHPVALDQCRSFFRDHPWLEAVAAWDTAGSVRDLMAGGATWDAAIGSELACTLYGAEVLARDLEDDPSNFTRFLAVRTEAGPCPEDPAKVSLAFTLPNVPGSLHRVLGIFAALELDLSRLECRPLPGRPWEYRFYADLRGTARARREAALAALREIAVVLRVIGVYPEAPG
ncbi:MAG: prephenate dehydratase domain-containing protein [Longimicrobiales bacterium]|nr:prephenate dehydratase domain-containing protein [Longimicrobiales bacterium]